MDYSSYILIAVAFVLGIGATIWFGHLGAYKNLTIYEVADDMVPIEAAVLEEIAQCSESLPGIHSERYRPRKRLRHDLHSIEDRLRRILNNAARPKYWALNERRMLRENKYEHPPEVVDGFKQLLEAEKELWWLTVPQLIRIRLWTLTRFDYREWGPVPDIRKFRLREILQAYNNVMLSAIELARATGEAVVAEDIAAAM